MAMSDSGPFDFEVIFTEASSGRTVIELWRGGRREDGEEQVVQEGASTSQKPAPAPTGRATSTTPLPMSAAVGEEAQAVIPNNSLTRKGERTREFYFGGIHGSRSGQDDEGAGHAREVSRRLRTETERERRSKLRDIFEAAHSLRRRRRRDSGRGGDRGGQ